MAYARKRRATKRPARKATRRVYKAKTARKSSAKRQTRYAATKRRKSTAGAKTIRIVLEQPTTSPIARPELIKRIVRGPII